MNEFIKIEFYATNNFRELPIKITWGNNLKEILRSNPTMFIIHRGPSYCRSHSINDPEHDYIQHGFYIFGFCNKIDAEKRIIASLDKNTWLSTPIFNPEFYRFKRRVYRSSTERVKTGERIYEDTFIFYWKVEIPVEILQERR